jgi:hypothetical protein
VYRSLVQCLPPRAAEELEKEMREGGAVDDEDDDWPGNGDITEFLQTPAPEVDWFARERLLADRAHLLAGIGGSSKTRLLYHLGAGAVLGRVPWGWEIDRTGSAALFLTEDTRGGVHRMVGAMRDAMGLSEDELALLAERLRVYAMAGKSSRLLAAAGGGVLIETSRVQRILAAVRALPQPVAFIGLDPALGLTEGDELNPAHQRRLGELADRIAIETGACVVLATHAAKGIQSLEELGSHSARGSGALTDAVRGEYVLRTMTLQEGRQFGLTDLEERRAHVQLCGVKGNEMPPGAFVPMWLRRGRGGMLCPVELQKREGGQMLGEREDPALEILQQLAQTSAPSLKVWRDACLAAGLLDGKTEAANEKAMQRIRNALLKAGLVEKGVGRGIFVPARQETP